MQLKNIDSEDIVAIKMSTLEESQDNQVSALINDIKKDIQSNVQDDLKVKDGEAADIAAVVSKLAEGVADIIDVKPEIQLNGRSEDEIIPNGAPETPNNDKENDAPKDSEIVVKVENIVEITANSISTVEINKNEAITDNVDPGNDNASSTLDETAKKDVVNSVIDNKLEINKSESEGPGIQPLNEEKVASGIPNFNNSNTSLNEKPLENNEEADAEMVSDSEVPSIERLDGEKATCEIPNSNNSNTLNEKPIENNEQVDAKLVSDTTNIMEISAAKNTETNQLTSFETNKSTIVIEEIKSADSKENTKERETESSQMEIDVNEVVENISKDEADKSAIVESNGQLELPAESIGMQNRTSTISPKDFNETDVSVDEQKKLFKPEDQEKSESGDLRSSEAQKVTPTDVEKKNNTIQLEAIADPVVNSVVIKASKDKISSLNDRDKQTSCKKDIQSVTEDKTVLTEENKTNSESIENIASGKVKDSIITDATLTDIENNSNKQIDNEMIVDVSENESKSEQIDKSDSSLSDEKNNEVSKKSQVQQDSGDPNDSKSIVENPVVEKLKDTDCVSVSSMEVDDDEIVPTEKVKRKINKGQDDSMDVLVTNNEDQVIEIFDQDVVESTDNVKSKKQNEANSDTKTVDKPSTKTEEKLEDKVDISDEDDIKIVEDTKTKPEIPKKEEPSVENTQLPVVCKLSNTLDILSDEEEEPPAKVSKVEEKKPKPEDKQCIDIDDDDDIMLIEDSKETITDTAKAEIEKPQKTSDKVNDETGEKESSKSVEDPTPNINEKEPINTDIESPKLSEKEASPAKEIVKESNKPLLPINFLKSAKKNLAEMTRDELEEFCILKIVEGIVDRSSLSDIKSKMKNLEKNIEEYKKKAMLLSKQNRDLQVVLKSVQEEQKNRPNTSITPLKITRSVGMQVLMLDHKGQKKKPPPQNANVNTPKPITRNMVQPARPQKTPSNSQNIPVPRLIPASPAKTTPSSPVTTVAKPLTPNGIRNTVSPAQKTAEKRPMTRATTSSNMTVDLTDDEPPAKVNKSSPVPPVRLVPSQNLMAPVRSQIQTNNPRKVFIPINGQGPNLVRGQTAVMLKNVTQPMGPRQRLPSMPRMAANQVRMTVNRHPAPLPDVMKQYQPPTWKALPPAPDLKLSKVENGIVISWKIEGYQEDSYEKIASYQLYAYQETSTPPSTALWKKIGDVKALPLPMACTLTQFMAGFKYYFAVRAVDVKSRLGPFSLPGSILLLNKM